MKHDPEITSECVLLDLETTHPSESLSWINSLPQICYLQFANNNGKYKATIVLKEDPANSWKSRIPATVILTKEISSSTMIKTPHVDHLSTLAKSDHVIFADIGLQSSVFVVEKDHVTGFLELLHSQKDDHHGQSSTQFEDVPIEKRETWWKHKRDQLLQLARDKTPLYVYDGDTIRHSAKLLTTHLTSIKRIFYAMKANSNAEIMKLLYQANFGFECLSPGELDYIFKMFPDISPDRVLFTPNFAPKSEYLLAFQRGVNVTVDCVHPLKHWPDVFKNQKILLRLDPGTGRGHHQFVKTAGKTSKFGISMSELETVAQLAKEAGATIVGLHAHPGSGIFSPESWTHTARYLRSVSAEYFPDVQYLDIGGGLGVPEHDDQFEIELTKVNDLLLTFKKEFPKFDLWLEPGRFLVAAAGVLLAKVTQIKHKENLLYVGIDTGFNTLIRPVLYGAYHRIYNLSKLYEPMTTTAEIVGNICESGDCFGHQRSLPESQEGDVILIDTVGAYGRSMSSNYNLREPAAEHVIL